MVNINKKYLENNLSNFVWRNFIQKVKKARTKKDFVKLFNRFFTPAERIMLKKRMAIISLAKQGLSQREIGRILDVSPTTVGFVKRGFLNKKRVLRKNFRQPVLERTKNNGLYPKFSTFTGRGRWRFLNSF